MTTDKILQHALGMKLRTGLGMLVIDYLGILDDQYGRTPYERITRISRQLKMMARILGVPVVVASQLNRESAMRDESAHNYQTYEIAAPSSRIQIRSSYCIGIRITTRLKQMTIRPKSSSPNKGKASPTK